MTTLSRALIYSISSAVLAPLAMADNPLSIRCSGDAVGAKAYLNGTFIGDCDARVDYFVQQAGEHQLRLLKTLPDAYEQSHQQTINIVANSVKRVRVKSLSKPQLSASSKVQKLKQQYQLAQDGDLAAMKQLADYYEQGFGTKADPASAKKWRMRLGAAKNKAAANKRYQDSLSGARTGDISAMRKVAEMYDKGLGTAKSATKRDYWKAEIDKRYHTHYLAAAKSGEFWHDSLEGDERLTVDDAMAALAENYRLGRGTAKNEAQATYWFEQIKPTLLDFAEQGYVQAMNQVKYAYLEGEKGFEEDVMKSLEWDEKSREQRIQYQIDEYKAANPTFPLFAEMMDTISELDGDVPSPSLYGMIVPTTFIPAYLTSLPTDLTNSPSATSGYREFREGLVVAPAVWAAPKSMIAKSAR